MSNGLLNRIRKKDEVNKRLFLSILVLFFDYFPKGKRRNLPEYGRIPSFVWGAALDKMHYVNCG